MKEEATKEQLILQAAEEEFLLKGYSGAKTTSIAKKAGVTHAMLHYYYRTKENLFQKVFQQKAQMIGDAFEIILDENRPFEELLRAFVERHFDFVMSNPGLINFVYNEIRVNEENGLLLREVLRSKINYIAGRFGNIIKKETLKGTIREINPLDLFLNIVTLNLSSSIFFSIAGEFILDKKFEDEEMLLEKRKENNVQLILNSLKK